MFQKMLDLINKYDCIVIFRHSRPDMDALGSQLGLKNLLQENFPSKKIYAVGDMGKPCFLGEMDEIEDSIIQNSLAIICDTAVSNMIFDTKYMLAKERMIFDHHNNEATISSTYYYKDVHAAAAAQIIANFAQVMNLKVSKKTANCLYSGMITDSARFLFSLTPSVFDTASYLINKGVDYQMIYKSLYSESLKSKKMKAYFTSKFEVEDGVGFMFNTKEEVEKFEVSTFTISRGMVNVMADINEISIWCNFTEDAEHGNIIGEFRSNKISIVEIAKKYGGGGHDLACGATIESFEVAKQIIQDFKEILKGE